MGVFSFSFTYSFGGKVVKPKTESKVLLSVEENKEKREKKREKKNNLTSLNLTSFLTHFN